MASVPLADASVDAAVFSLALMGTDYGLFLQEASRVLSAKGYLWIAEVGGSTTVGDCLEFKSGKIVCLLECMYKSSSQLWQFLPSATVSNTLGLSTTQELCFALGPTVWQPDDSVRSGTPLHTKTGTSSGSSEDLLKSATYCAQPSAGGVALEFDNSNLPLEIFKDHQ